MSYQARAWTRPTPSKSSSPIAVAGRLLQVVVRYAGRFLAPRAMAGASGARFQFACHIPSSSMDPTAGNGGYVNAAMTRAGAASASSVLHEQFFHHLFK